MFNLDVIADLTKPKPHAMPTKEIFLKYMKEMDIRKSDEIILYDRINLFSSPRGFITLTWFGHKNVRILNGGFPLYLKKKGELEKDNNYNVQKLNEYRKNNIPIKEDDFDYNLEENRVYKIEQVFENMNSSIIIDARSEERFEGKVQEPRKSLRVGHIKSAINLFFQKLFDEEGKYKKISELKTIFTNIGVTGDKIVIIYCGTGLTACIDLFALYQIGLDKNIKLYDGSWMDYGNLPEEEIQKLEEKFKK